MPLPFADSNRNDALPTKINVPYLIPLYRIAFSARNGPFYSVGFVGKDPYADTSAEPRKIG